MEVAFPIEWNFLSHQREVFLYQQNCAQEDTCDAQWSISFAMILGRKFCTSAMFLKEPDKAAE